jgi:hypothetical protein
MEQGNKNSQNESSTSETTKVSCTLLDKNFRKLMVWIIAVSPGDRNAAGEYYNSLSLQDDAGARAGGVAGLVK